MGEEQPETLMVHLSRQDSGQSWGFRLQGGMDFNTPLSVQVVQPKSVAERCGLRAGDGIIRINNAMTDGLSHEQAKMEIIRSCNDIDMLIMRGAVQIWRPKVTPMNELRPSQPQQPIQTATGDQIYTTQRTSLAKDKQDETCTIGNAYNRSARPFGGGGQPQQQQQQQQFRGPPQQLPNQPVYGGGGPNYGNHYNNAPESPKRAVPNVIHAQFNSPIGLYSADNIAHSYASQTACIEKEMGHLDVNDAPLGTRMTGTYQRLDSTDSGSQKDYGTHYGSPPKGDDDLPPESESSTSLQPGSSECLQNSNGVDEHASVSTNNTINTQPSGFRSVTAPTATSNPVPSGPKQENMHCTGCGNIVTGVFVRIKGMPYHDKCFKCARCGLFLKQKGYFIIDGQLLCEVHAKQASQPPGENMRPAGVIYR